MDRELICLIICFIVGIIIYFLIRRNCGCNVVEGNTEDEDDNYFCVVDMNCDMDAEKYDDFKCDQYCEFKINKDTDLNNISIPPSVTTVYTDTLNENIVEKLNKLNNLNYLYITIHIPKEQFKNLSKLNNNIKNNISAMYINIVGDITDINPISYFKNLEYLTIHQNGEINQEGEFYPEGEEGSVINNFEVIKNLTKLKTLIIIGGEITNIEPISNMVNLNNLIINNRSKDIIIKDISSISNIIDRNNLIVEINKRRLHKNEIIPIQLD